MADGALLHPYHGRNLPLAHRTLHGEQAHAHPLRLADDGDMYLSTATANKFAGTLSGSTPEAGKVKTLLGYRIETMYDFFMVFVVMSATASLILFLLSKKLQKMMHGVE